jgi:translation initiation factor 5A
MDSETFEENVGSGASLTTPIQANNVKKNGHVVINGFPCKVVEVSSSKTGKHGHAKVHIVAVDIFSGKKYEDVHPASHNVEEPVITRNEYTLIDISRDRFCTLMEGSGNTKENLKLPEGEYGDEIEKKYNEIKDDTSADMLVTVVGAMGNEQIMSYKISGK